MSRKSEFKENSASKPLFDSAKRQRMNENGSSSKAADDNHDLSYSVAVYADEDLSYYNKSSIARLAINPSAKRSPLATINKAGQGPSTSHHHSNPMPAKTPAKRIPHKECPPDPFQFLSDEVLLHIFTFLPKKALNRIAQVNSRFSRVIQDDTLWIRMDMANKLVRSGAMSVILSRGLIILRLAQAKIASPIFEPDFEEDFLCKLQYLDLSMASIDKTSLEQLLGICYSLKKVSLEALQLDESICVKLTQNQSLEVLNLAMCEGLNAKTVKLLMQRLKNLLTLNISWTNLDSDAVSAVVENIAPGIMRLNISGCRKSLMDKHLKVLADRCPNIVELDVSDCSKLTSETVKHVSRFTKLEYLSMSRCYDVQMTSYLTLNNIKSLLYIDLFGLLSDQGLAHIEKSFKNIGINRFVHSSVARPTVTPRRTSVWGLRTRD